MQLIMHGCDWVSIWVVPGRPNLWPRSLVPTAKVSHASLCATNSGIEEQLLHQMFILYRAIDDYLFLEPGDRITLCQDHRAIVRLPARSVRAAARSLWLLLTCSWTTLLLPVTIFASVSSGSAGKSASFWLDYLALLPCIGLFRYGSETLSLSAPSAVARTWNASFGAFSLDLEVHHCQF